MVYPKFVPYLCHAVIMFQIQQMNSANSFQCIFDLTAFIRLGRSRRIMLEMITTKTPTPKTTPIPLADGRGSDAHIFKSLALAVMFFCIKSIDLNSLIRCFSFSVSLDLIGAEPIAEQGHLHSKNINTRRIYSM